MWFKAEMSSSDPANLFNSYDSATSRAKEHFLDLIGYAIQVTGHIIKCPVHNKHVHSGEVL